MAPADPMLPAPFRVARARRENADTVTLELEPARGAAPFRFEAGQFTMLWAFGAGEAPISISGDPAREGPLVHTIRAVGRTTRALASLRRGASLGVRGPFGSGWPLSLARGRDLVLVAGGIGLAPLRPVILGVLAERAAFGRVSVAYGARTPDARVFAREAAAWGRKGIRFEATVDAGGPDWKASVGPVTALVPRLVAEPLRTVAFVCGPEIMMRFATSALRAAGVRSEDVFVSMERNMKCAIGLCGHCQLGPDFVCRDGPVFPLARAARYFEVREL